MDELKPGDYIQLFGNSFMHMLGISRATGIVKQVRKLGDGFTFMCHETKTIETIEDGDGEVQVINESST